jgi:hypothetical protein
MFGHPFLLRDRAQNIAGAGNMREVDLGLDFVFNVSGARFRRGRGGLGVSTQMLADQFRFMLFQRTGVRLLLGNAHHRQNVKNRLALDFQFPGQIVDSNLAHPLSRFFVCPAKFAYLTSRTQCASNMKPPTLRTSNARSGRASGIAIRCG